MKILKVASSKAAVIATLACAGGGAAFACTAYITRTETARRLKFGLLAASSIVAGINISGEHGDTTGLWEFGIPYNFMWEGFPYDGVYRFPDSFFVPDLHYCAADHRDPDGNQYIHGHAYEAFPIDMGGGWFITAAMSDEFWDDFYKGRTRLSGSTFLHNCYSYATDAPTVMPVQGYLSFTVEMAKCDPPPPQKKKSFYDDHHAVVIEKTANMPYGGVGCVLTQTSEKNQSGGVYRGTFALPGGRGDYIGQAVRRMK